jgi:hypothetical protein
MTDPTMALRTLLEKSSDTDLLREMIGFTAQRRIGPVKQFMHDHSGDSKVLWLVLPELLQKARIAFHQGNDGVAIKQEFHAKKSSSGRSCSAGCVVAASAKSLSTGPIIVANQAQSCAKGSRITAFPCRRMRTSSVSKQNSLGSLTACERPD